MRQLINRQKQYAELSRNGLLIGQKGIITGFDPNTWKVAVTFFPVGDTPYAPGTANIPLGSFWVGNGFGAFFWPTLGSRVVVFYEMGDYKNPIGISQIFDQAENLPLNGIQEGEGWIVHKSGSRLVFKQDGSIEIQSNEAVNIKTEQANISVNGSSLKKLVNEEFQSLYNDHTHPTPSGESSPPTQQMTNDQLTTVLKAQ